MDFIYPDFKKMRQIKSLSPLVSPEIPIKLALAAGEPLSRVSFYKEQVYK